MDLSNLKKYKDSTKKHKRVGRGESSGLGKTSGRGHKGLKSRSGGKVRPGFEGGQTPLYRQLPKLKGFNALKPKDYDIVGLRTIDNLKEKNIDPETLKRYRIISKHTNKVKVLATGEIGRAVNIKAHYFSKNALEAIQAAGGKAEVLDG